MIVSITTTGLLTSKVFQMLLEKRVDPGTNRNRLSSSNWICPNLTRVDVRGHKEIDVDDVCAFTGERNTNLSVVISAPRKNDSFLSIKNGMVLPVFKNHDDPSDTSITINSTFGSANSHSRGGFHQNDGFNAGFSDSNSDSGGEEDAMFSAFLSPSNTTVKITPLAPRQNKKNNYQYNNNNSNGSFNSHSNSSSSNSRFDSASNSNSKFDSASNSNSRFDPPSNSKFDSASNSNSRFDSPSNSNSRFDSSSNSNSSPNDSSSNYNSRFDSPSKSNSKFDSSSNSNSSPNDSSNSFATAFNETNSIKPKDSDSDYYDSSRRTPSNSTNYNSSSSSSSSRFDSNQNGNESGRQVSSVSSASTIIAASRSSGGPPIDTSQISLYPAYEKGTYYWGQWERGETNNNLWNGGNWTKNSYGLGGGGRGILLGGRQPPLSTSTSSNPDIEDTRSKLYQDKPYSIIKVALPRSILKSSPDIEVVQLRMPGNFMCRSGELTWGKVETILSLPHPFPIRSFEHDTAKGPGGPGGFNFRCAAKPGLWIVEKYGVTFNDRVSSHNNNNIKEVRGYLIKHVAVDGKGLVRRMLAASDDNFKDENPPPEFNGEYQDDDEDDEGGNGIVELNRWDWNWVNGKEWYFEGRNWGESKKFIVLDSDNWVEFVKGCSEKGSDVLVGGEVMEEKQWGFKKRRGDENFGVFLYGGGGGGGGGRKGWLLFSGEKSGFFPKSDELVGIMLDMSRDPSIQEEEENSFF